MVSGLFGISESRCADGGGLQVCVIWGIKTGKEKKTHISKSTAKVRHALCEAGLQGHIVSIFAECMGDLLHTGHGTSIRMSAEQSHYHAC